MKSIPTRLAFLTLAAAATAATLGATELLAAEPAPAAVVVAQATPADAAAPAAGKMLDLVELERRVTALGLRVTEIEVRDLLAEVEARDEQGREVELVLDRRTGEVLSRRLDD